MRWQCYLDKTPEPKQWPQPPWARSPNPLTFTTSTPSKQPSLSGRRAAAACKSCETQGPETARAATFAKLSRIMRQRLQKMRCEAALSWTGKLQNLLLSAGSCLCSVVFLQQFRQRFPPNNFSLCAGQVSYSAHPPRPRANSRTITGIARQARCKCTGSWPMSHGNTAMMYVFLLLLDARQKSLARSRLALKTTAKLKPWLEETTA